MGNCAVIINVTGCHHNGIPSDIDQMAARFADELRASGHVVTSAVIVSGGEQNLMSVASRMPLKE